MVIRALEDEKKIVFNDILSSIIGWDELSINEDDFILIKCNFGKISISEIEGESFLVASDEGDIGFFGILFDNTSDVIEVTSKNVNLKNGMVLSIEDGYFEFNKATSEITAFFIGDNLKISAQEPFSASSVFTLQDNPFFTATSIDAIPSISLGAFDYYVLGDPKCCLIQRPVRYGIPVISTVPVPTQLTTPDDFSIPSSIIIHFRIIINKYLSSSLDNLIQLQIYLPDGEDTMKSPVNLSVTRITVPSQVNLGSDIVLTGGSATHSVYVCSYTFYREDSKNFVDGFMYLNVYVPMQINSSISGACITNNS
jgi:hypothetical protein